jgi:Aromatic acid exporter family member 1
VTTGAEAVRRAPTVARAGIHRVLDHYRWRFGRGGRSALLRALRLTSAAMLAYVVADVLLSGPPPVLAPLTALLVVQVTLFSTLTDGLRRVISVVAGVLLAVLVAEWVGFSFWSLAAAIGISILIGQLLRLGPHLLEVPISAMLVLSVGGGEAAAGDRIVQTLLGAAVGVGANLLFPPAVQARSAGARVEAFAQRMSGVLDGMADEIHQRVTVDQARRWLDEARQLTVELVRVDEAIVQAAESRRLNPRAVGTFDPSPELRSGIESLEHAATALRGLCRALVELIQEQESAPDTYDPDVREAFAVLLRELADAIRAFGTLVRREAEGTLDPEGADIWMALESLREARARLTELLLVDPRHNPHLWELHGSLLLSAERVLRELDVEERAREREQRRRQELAERTRTVLAVDRLRTGTRQLRYGRSRRPRTARRAQQLDRRIANRAAALLRRLLRRP